MLKLKYYMKPLSNINKVFSLVQQQERQPNGNNPVESKGFINNSNT